MIRKKGKLPAKTISVTYELEYGEDEIFMHEDAISADEKVLIVDDLLATGGTTRAAIELVKKTGAEIVGVSVLIELEDLHGRDKLADYRVDSLIRFNE
ncbi:adenine phosphoribosyltransferase, partial [Elusimicrobiota bacterium]